VADVQYLLSLGLGLILFGVKIFALIDCVARKAGEFELASQVSKNGWLVILGLSLAAHLVTFDNPLRLLNLAGTLAALVYLAQLRGRSF